jgi:hypothetical protein
MTQPAACSPGLLVKSEVGVQDAWVRDGVGSDICSSRNMSLTANGSLGLSPVREDVIHRRIGGIDRLHNAKPLRILGIDLERVARVVAIEVEGGDDDRGIDTDRIHRRYHLLAGRRCRAVQLPGPGPAGMVACVGRAPGRQ